MPFLGSKTKVKYEKTGTWTEPTNNVPNGLEGSRPSSGNPAGINPNDLSKANPDDPTAQYNLGVQLVNQGAYVQAALMFRKAAEASVAEAQFNLGVLYFQGRGVPQSFVEAYFWEDLATALVTEDRQAQFANARDFAATKLSDLERGKVQARADEWFSSHQPRSR